MSLEHLALSRSTLDRAAHRRGEPELTAALLKDPSTKVLVLAGDLAPVTQTPAGPRLLLRPAEELDGAPALVAFLGVDSGGAAHLVHAAGSQAASPRGARLAGLREVGGLLDATDAGILTTALALANWHATHPRCSRCGEPTEPVLAGWARRCPACGAEHYPRTDPAVIMSVMDDAGRILLGRQAVWPAKRYSTLAGFVEPGESLEAAVRREVFEEAGIVIDRVAYHGSQPWPFPASLMLAFRAQATTTDIQVDGEELAAARWWTREELALDVATEELLLPPPVSVARHLIENWYGGPIRDAGGVWR